MSFIQFMLPRLEGNRLAEKFPRYLDLVKGGVAGFIVFDAELESLRQCVRELQQSAQMPLIIAADLEQGLGQHVRGGTLFPPAMAMAEAGHSNHALLRQAYAQMADEALYAGINTIFAPVLDINTNPRNPIIATRAFGEDTGTVASISRIMIETFRARGVLSCGKHFPGHGDTEVDSHINLPALTKPIDALEATELVPFHAAIKAQVDMIMLAHMSVPALDPSGTPVSISALAINYLRRQMGYSGIAITDALNMGGLGGYTPDEAALMALRAGVDILLHPINPEDLNDILKRQPERFSADRLIALRKSLPVGLSNTRPEFDPALSNALTSQAIKVVGNNAHLNKPMVIVLSDDPEEHGAAFVDCLSMQMPSVTSLVCHERAELSRPPDMQDLIVCVFSKVRAWKGGTASWIKDALTSLERPNAIFVSFGSPYILDCLAPSSTKVYAWWGAETAQSAVGEEVVRRINHK